jgi:hypothetical protein
VAGKVDFKRELTGFYIARRSPAVVEVPELAFLMIDGHGDPTPPGSTAMRCRRCSPSPTRRGSRSSARASSIWGDAVGGAVVGERHGGVLGR